MNARNVVLLAATVALGAAPALAQSPQPEAGDRIQVALNDTGSAPAAAPADSTTPAAKAASMVREIKVQNIRPYDQRGVNMFEAPKSDAPFAGFAVDWGAAFTQQFQNIDHSNTAAPRLDANGVNQNQLAEIGSGFNLATANLYLDAQLAPGIRVALESYMSSRHHNEFWVKGGYLQIDESPIDLPVLNTLMDYLTIKAGMFEQNYGDAHFRRSDNGATLYNPFVENYILDSFNTEIGAEVYARTGPWLAMVGVTNGVNKGSVVTPDDRGFAYLGKLGFDQQLTPLVRVRLTGSMYTVDKTPSNNLYGGDRAGSRYYNVMDNATGSQFTNGRLNPGLRNELTAYQINPFVKVGGLELFGVLEQAEGKTKAETERRQWNQYAVDAVYRFLPREQLFVGGRYNTAAGELAGVTEEVSIDRTALSAGWFITPSILLKGEYVRQTYNDFPTNSILNGGKFDGFVLEGAVSF